MNSEEFRKFGYAVIDFIADYRENIRERQVLPSVNPGYLHNLLPKEIPENPEKWREILEDFNNLILPGITHWQSPNFHAYFPGQSSYPSIIGEMLSAGLGVVGFNWIASPACTELEAIVMDWLGKFLDLPKQFLTSASCKGGGVIQASASESIFVAVLTAREQKVCDIKLQRPELTEAKIRDKLVGYGSIHSNSAIEKTGILAAIKMRLLETDENSILRGEKLQEAIEADLSSDLIPFVCIATVGTTGTCAFDNLEEIGPVCKKFNLWMHVDAAYAGSSFCLPEYCHIKKGIEFSDSINVNLHKWMLVNYDCCAMWIKNSGLIVDTFKIQRIYMENQERDDPRAPEYRHWQLGLGRRFRALKVWITLRTYGQEAIRKGIRKDISLAKYFLILIQDDERFEIIGSNLGLALFRLKNGCILTKKLLKKINERKNIYVNPAMFQEKLVIRFAVCGIEKEIKDIEFAWKEIKVSADKILREDAQLAQM